MVVACGLDSRDVVTARPCHLAHSLEVNGRAVMGFVGEMDCGASKDFGAGMGCDALMDCDALSCCGALMGCDASSYCADAAIFLSYPCPLDRAAPPKKL